MTIRAEHLLTAVPMVSAFSLTANQVLIINKISSLILSASPVQRLELHTSFACFIYFYFEFDLSLKTKFGYVVYFDVYLSLKSELCFCCVEAMTIKSAKAQFLVLAET